MHIIMFSDILIILLISVFLPILGYMISVYISDLSEKLRIESEKEYRRKLLRRNASPWVENT